MRRLDERIAVAGQIMPEDLPELAAAGVTTIVNNRPDGEEPSQPSAEALGAAARTAGLDYHFIPVSGGLSAAQVQAMVDAMTQADGTLLAFCRSGTRSTYLWALARSSQGADAEELVRQAAAAGYDLSPVRAYLG